MGPKSWDLAAKIVQPKIVEWAIMTSEPYKASGPDTGHISGIPTEGNQRTAGSLNEDLQDEHRPEICSQNVDEHKNCLHP